MSQFYDTLMRGLQRNLTPDRTGTLAREAQQMQSLQAPPIDALNVPSPTPGAGTNVIEMLLNAIRAANRKGADPYDYLDMPDAPSSTSMPPLRTPSQPPVDALNVPSPGAPGMAAPATGEPSWIERMRAATQAREAQQMQPMAVPPVDAMNIATPTPAAPGMALPTSAGPAGAPQLPMPGSYQSPMTGVMPGDQPQLPMPNLPTPPGMPQAPAGPATPPGRTNMFQDPKAYENLLHFGLALMAASDASQGNGVRGPSLAGAIGKAGLATQGRVDTQRTTAATTAREDRKFATETAIKRKELELRSFQITQDAETKRLLYQIRQDNERFDRELQRLKLNSETANRISQLTLEKQEAISAVGFDPDLETEDERRAAIRQVREQYDSQIKALMGQQGAAPGAKAASQAAAPRVSYGGKTYDKLGPGQYREAR
jgi:hypothetical protein